jgi:hypothetical protein
LGVEFKTPPPKLAVLARRTAPAIALLALSVAGMAYYDYRVFGNPITLPYTVNRATYASAPHFLWQSPRPEPVYRHSVMRKFYSGWELDWFLKSRTPGGLVKNSIKKVLWAESFYLGFALAIPWLSFPFVFRDKRIRFLLVTAGTFVGGLAVETWFIPHYLAPLTAVLYAILLQCMRHLRVWRPEGRRSGLLLVRAVPVICSVLVGLRLYAAPLHISLTGDTYSAKSWFGTLPRGLARARVLSELRSKPGLHIAIVRYSPVHDPIVEWVYNGADIDRSKVIWAREMDVANNRELLAYYHNRDAWLVEPDANPPRVSPYRLETEPAKSATSFTFAQRNSR